MDFKNVLEKLSQLSGEESSEQSSHLMEGRRLQDRMVSEESDKKERPYICVHAKYYAPYECHATSTYEAAKMAAEHWGMKSTAGIDVHLADVEHTAVNEYDGSVKEGKNYTLTDKGVKAFKPIEKTEKLVRKMTYKGVTIIITKDIDRDMFPYQLYIDYLHHDEFNDLEQAEREAKFEIEDMKMNPPDTDPDQMRLFKESKPVNESLKDIFNKLSEELLSENEISMEPAQQNAQVIKKNDEVIGTVSNPGLASQLKRGIESGEVSLDQEMNEDAGHSVVDVVGENQVDDLALYIHEGRDPLEPETLKRLMAYYKDQIPKGLSGEKLQEFLVDKAVDDYGDELEEIFYRNKQNDPDYYESDPDRAAEMDMIARGILPEDAGHSILDVISPQELEELKGYVSGDSDNFYGSDLFMKLYDYYLESGEMPIDIAKNRTGDSDQWILDRVEQDYGSELSEGARPHHDSDFGAGLGAGRSEIALEGRTKKDNKAEKAGKKVTKDIEYDEKDKDKIHGKKRHAEDEKAEKAGKKVAKDIEYDEKKKSKKKMNESMEECVKAAELEGKSHGLKGHAHIGDSFDTPEKARAYHQGYKDGLDERFGMRDVEPAATVPGMASQSMDTDLVDYSDDADFGAWEKELNEILENDKDEDPYQEKIDKIMARLERESKKHINPDILNNLHADAYDEIRDLENERDNLKEGLSVSISKGHQGTPDTVSITAQDNEAEELLQLAKKLSSGVFGDNNAEVSDYGAPKADHGVDDHDHMMSLMKAVDEPKSSCYEDESEDQMEFKVAEDNQPDSGAKDSIADEDAEAQEDQALAGAMSGNEEEVDEDSHHDKDVDLMELLDSLDKIEEENHEVDKDDALEEEEQMDETNAFIAARRDAIKKGHDEFEVDGKKFPVKGADDKEDEDIDEGMMDRVRGMNYDRLAKRSQDKATKAMMKAADFDFSDLDNREEHEDEFMRQMAARDERENKANKLLNRKPVDENLNEWANDAGRDGTDEAFQQDIDFMTKVISGGINKQKKDQTTLPHTKVSVDDGESAEDLAKLAGIKK